MAPDGRLGPFGTARSRTHLVGWKERLRRAEQEDEDMPEPLVEYEPGTEFPGTIGKTIDDSVEAWAGAAAGSGGDAECVVLRPSTTPGSGS